MHSLFLLYFLTVNFLRQILTFLNNYAIIYEDIVKIQSGDKCYFSIIKVASMKKIDISSIVISKINDVYGYAIARDTECEAVAEHNVLIIKSRGVSEYLIGGKKYVADSENIVLIPKGAEYGMYICREGECVIVEFDTVEPIGAPYVLGTGGDKEIVACVRSIIQYWKLKGPAYQSKCMSELYNLITRLSTVHYYTYSLAGKYRMIHKSVKYIEANYRRADLYTPDLAKMSGMGETYYRNIFLSVFSVPPAKYIQNYRVEKAKELLVNSKLSIDEIAIATGFANASYFCKVFKSTTGLTPTEFALRSKKLG